MERNIGQTTGLTVPHLGIMSAGAGSSAPANPDGSLTHLANEILSASVMNRNYLQMLGNRIEQDPPEPCPPEPCPPEPCPLESGAQAAPSIEQSILTVLRNALDVQHGTTRYLTRLAELV